MFHILASHKALHIPILCGKGFIKTINICVNTWRYLTRMPDFKSHTSAMLNASTQALTETKLDSDSD